MRKNGTGYKGAKSKRSVGTGFPGRVAPKASVVKAARGKSKLRTSMGKSGRSALGRRA